MAPVNEVLQKAQFVMDADGHATAAVLDIQTWEALLDWLEEFGLSRLERDYCPNAVSTCSRKFAKLR
jgi:hypothetical protein